MKSGTFAFRYTILGYRRGENGEPEIIPEEAEVVRKIFNMYLEGASLDQIKSYLETNGIKTKKGKSVWSKQIIQDMLCNERFAGDMLLQKTYIENCINKKVKKNRGEMAKYLITNNHPAIISKETFKLVQAEIARRSSKRKTSDLSITEQGSEKVNQEIESIKKFLADTEINFSEYNEIVVRKLIECIRVMPDGTLVIVLKGGMTIEEQIAA
ncbi:MAG: recombinase family protein [Ruminococcus sp.]|nr:recombinase family protein [Ruminococcus sp.]